MIRKMLGGKIHRARVTAADLDYVGSVTIDPRLMDASGILPHEHVQIVDVTNGARIETYAIPGEPGSGEVQINGAAAHLVHEGDLVIIMSYVRLDDVEARTWSPRVALVDADANNAIVEVRGGVQPGVFRVG